ncbi:MAG: hypothetical protein AABX47_08025 [Nanoarchaeota archaeon]
MKRINLAILVAAILGAFCIIGAGMRLGYAGNAIFLSALFVNRLVIGLVIGLAGGLKLIKNKTWNTILRGAMLGLIISGSFYLTTLFYDTPGFFAGIVYGMIIDYCATRWGKQ